MKNSLNHKLIIKALLIYAGVLLVIAVIGVAVLTYKLAFPPSSLEASANPQLTTMQQAIDIITDQTFDPESLPEIQISSPPSTQSASPSATRG